MAYEAHGMEEQKNSGGRVLIVTLSGSKLQITDFSEDDHKLLLAPAYFSSLCCPLAPILWRFCQAWKTRGTSNLPFIEKS